MKASNVAIQSLFPEIKKQTGYSFFYDVDLIARAKKVSVNIKKQPLKAVLELLFSGQPFTYSIEGRIITLSPLPVQRPTAAVQTQIEIVVVQNQLVPGAVKTKTGAAIPGVTIKKTGSRTAIFSADAQGQFIISLRKGDKLLLTAVGFEDAEIEYAGQPQLQIVMNQEVTLMESIEVSDGDFFKKRKVPWTDTVDLTHRSHLNLGQVLQGTVPGLTLQNSSQSERVLSGLTVGRNGSFQDLEYLKQTYADLKKQIPHYMEFDKFIAALMQSSSLIKANYGTSVSNNGLIPQLRGVSGFNGNTSGMLIVIDGFPQKGFPADYPMNNVESVKVIKDPEELAKWGPGASGGVILITTKKGTSGKIELNYSTNLYYAPAPVFNRKALRLASSPDVLDYLKAASDSGFINLAQKRGNGFTYDGFNKNPAQQLLQGLITGRISGEAFNEKWDSLAAIDNEAQMHLLQQSSFRQNHMLTLSGSTKGWQFRGTGSYNTDRSTALNDENHGMGLNLMNNFDLLKGKLRATWFAAVGRQKGRRGSSFDPLNNSLQPYQLLLDPQGNYVYDYSGFNPDANAILEHYGYENHGVNLLQDARVNKQFTNVLNLQSRLNMDWKLLPGLIWTTALQYSSTESNSRYLQDALSSQTRQLINNYGSPVTDEEGNISGIDFYVPRGSILKEFNVRALSWNLRSALLYDRYFGQHHIAISLGGGGFDNTQKRPSYNTIYGYDPETGGHQAVKLPSADPQSALSKYYTSLPLPTSISTIGWGAHTLSYPYTLLTPNAGDTSVNRGLNWNGNFSYSFKNIYMLKGRYNAILNPRYGSNPPFSRFDNYYGEAIWRLSNYSFIPLPEWISDLSLSSGISGMQMPDLPVQINAIRSLQNSWNNYGIWVNEYNTAQQSGQSMHHVFEKMSLGFDQNRFRFDISYNTRRLQNNANGADTVIRYIGVQSKLNLRNAALKLLAGYGRSPEGQPQSNISMQYDIARESYFHSKKISSLSLDYILQQISSFQGMELMADTYVPESGGGYNIAVSNNFGLLPPRVKNMEVHAGIGFLKDRYLLDLRYYHKTTDGLNNNTQQPVDPATGLQTQVSYSQIINKGLELYLKVQLIARKKLNYTVILNGAYNQSIAENVPVVNYSQSVSYLSAPRNGFNTDNLWSYRWGGLDPKGDPQIYTANGQKTAAPDSAILASALVYSGVTRAPYTGGFIQELNVSGFFARITMLFNLGHVMREYIPVPSGAIDNSVLIRDRWRKPGDELFTNVPAMANTNATNARAFITQNATNSILPADYMRLQEVQFGWQLPRSLLRHLFIKDLTASVQVLNLAFWARNKYHIDPETVASGGQIGLTQNPRQYSLTLNVDF
ncbi:secretin and TonB N-terminal domain-containing protein [Niabella pedocola]|uniref:Secretin and TonB N-terminal domain-containing protein n=1 Tax=Niabella pedocola TaxID=1752077 RepID=A0ABS8PXA5_9BACT|nr:SusC/RagA family TonB-linked outer membrane protein [Niabella pedocola]MCD2425686.1 secretin and TonB N-terminal domain-containing protein [Niabella pedocola]